MKKIKILLTALSHAAVVPAGMCMEDFDEKRLSTAQRLINDVKEGLKGKSPEEENLIVRGAFQCALGMSPMYSSHEGLFAMGATMSQEGVLRAFQNALAPRLDQTDHALFGYLFAYMADQEFPQNNWFARIINKF